MKRENYQLIKALRHELHAHPELSHQEVWTRARLIAFLREHTLEIVEHDQWFIHREEGADVICLSRRHWPFRSTKNWTYLTAPRSQSAINAAMTDMPPLCGLGLEAEG